MRLIEIPCDEIQKRVERFQEKLREKGLRGAVLTNDYNIYYFTGYRAHAPWTTFTRPIWLFVPSFGTLVLFVQVFVFPEAVAKSAFCDVRSFDSLEGTPLNDVVNIMEELGMATGMVGWELGKEQRVGIPILEFLELKNLLSKVNFADVSEVLWDLRTIKSSFEIACIRKACQATSYALDSCFKFIREGMTEKEIANCVYKLMLEKGAERPGFVIIVSGEGNYNRISGTATDRPITIGDLVWIDAGAIYKGYWSDFCRAGVVGRASAEQTGYQEMVHMVTEGVIEKVQPGVSVADLTKECFAFFEKLGFSLSFNCGRLGHGMGLMSTEPPSVMLSDHTVLKPGMILNLEPGIVNEYGVFDIEENLLVTENGCEVLSGAERTLYEIASN